MVGDDTVIVESEEVLAGQARTSSEYVTGKQSQGDTSSMEHHRAWDRVNKLHDGQ